MSSSRLYISPLNPSLTQTILSPAQQSHATNVSYHSVPTFPEKAYGYVELPAEEAQRLRKKYNGSILRGMKMRVEEARPEKKSSKRKANEDDATAADQPPAAEPPKPKRAKKEKIADGVLSGVALPEHREVKRGWVQPPLDKKGKKTGGKDDGGNKRAARKDKEKSQMIFRTVLPPNVAANTADEEVKKRKDKSKNKRKRDGDATRLATEVQEFTHSTKFPTFLRGAQAHGVGSKATEFVEGEGWVDGQGTVVEAPKIRPQRRVTAPPEPSAAVPKSSRKARTAKAPSPEESEVSESSEEPSSDSSNGDSASDGSDNEDLAEDQATPIPTAASATAEPLPSVEAAPPTVTITATATEPKPIHPLEALYKRPSTSTTTLAGPTTAVQPSTSTTNTPRPAPIQTTFSFFDANDDPHTATTAAADDDDDTTNVPKTPFTQRDLESRGQRSAAPTPDTAAVGKRVRAPWSRGGSSAGGNPSSSSSSSSSSSDSQDSDDNDDDDDRAASAPAPAPAVVMAMATDSLHAAPAREQTEFEKHFWEHRGEYNRSWKQRKREAKKESRQSENRRRGGGGGSGGGGVAARGE